MRAPWLIGSVLLHGAGLAALAMLPARDAPAPDQPVQLVWQVQEEGAADPLDAAPSAPVMVPAPTVAAAPPAPAAPPSPPPPPAPPVLAEAIAPPPDALPSPPPPVTAPPRQAAQNPPPRPRPPAPRPAQPGPAQAAPVQTVGAGIALGAVSPPRPASGAANVAPEYPLNSRMRGEQGRVTLRVQVGADGQVAEVEIVATSGFATLDRAAQRAVRGWRFEPAMQDGRPVPATVSVPVTFRLEAERRW